MSTTRTVTAARSGPVTLHSTLSAIDLHVTTEARSHGEITVSTADDDGPSADTVNAATLNAHGGDLTVRVDHTGGMTITHTGHGGTFTQTNVGGGVFIAGDNYGVTVVDGRIASGRGTYIRGGSPVVVTARLPHGSTVVAGSQSGDITCDGVFDDVDASSQSGDVRIGTAARVTAQTQSGDIDVDALTGSGRLSSMSGDITVHGPASASCTARTMSGDVRSSGGIDVQASTMSGRVRNR